MKVTIVMPCLNEAETLAVCIRKASNWLERAGIDGEVLVADNGSTDGSIEIALAQGARVVEVEQRGYGSALFYGAMAARGQYVVMGDADDSYDFSNLDPFMEKLDEGYDLVMGNRFLGGIEEGAMPWKNRYIGNPALTWVGRFLFNCPAKDFHCGLRAVRKSALQKMDLRTTGMEFASEMVIKANMLNLKIAEVPTTLSRDGRSRPPHLRPWQDGWRHLRFMLLFSPRWLLFMPGLFVFLVCSAMYFALLVGQVKLGGVVFDVHTLFYMQAGMVVGFLAIALGVTVRIFGIREGLLPKHPVWDRFQSSPLLETGAAAGVTLMLIGLLFGLRLLIIWGKVGFGDMQYGEQLRMVSFSSTLISFGGVIFLMALIMGFLSLPVRR